MASHIFYFRFESVLNGLMRIKNSDVYVIGSNAKFLSKDIVTEFRGRGDEIHINPLSYAEFMSQDMVEISMTTGTNMFYMAEFHPVVLLPTPNKKSLQRNLYK